jgi:hypothetical protein
VDNRFLFTIGLLGASAAIAADDQLVTYQKGMIGDTYSDKTTGKGTWKISAVVRANKPPASAGKMAMYRASELAIAKGFKYVQIISFKEKELTNYAGGVYFTSGYKVNMVTGATNERDASNHCEAEIKITCATFDAAIAQEEIRPFLKFKEAKN